MTNVARYLMFLVCFIFLTLGSYMLYQGTMYPPTDDINRPIIVGVLIDLVAGLSFVSAYIETIKA